MADGDSDERFKQAIPNEEFVPGPLDETSEADDDSESDEDQDVDAVEEEDEESDEAIEEL